MAGPVSSTTGATGVLLMAHGTPTSVDDMPEYLTRVREGRPPSAELVAEMRHHYETIGGRSPLTEVTLAQASALSARLGDRVPVAVGMRTWRPFIDEAVADLTAAGVTRVIGIPLAPQFSTLSASKYFDAVRAALPEGVDFDGVDSFHDHPLLLQAFSERLHEARPEPDEEVIFTAHSLPRRALADGDRYAEEVAATARGVADRARIARYHVAFQSAGRTPEPWIGPELGDLVRMRVERGARRFLVAPIGFVSDHTEVLFDVDHQATAVARSCDAALRRVPSLNDSPTFVAMLADLVEQRL